MLLLGFLYLCTIGESTPHFMRLNRSFNYWFCNMLQFYAFKQNPLILFTGARIGHRSLMRYYKQKFGLSRAVVVSRNQKAVGRVLQQYKALGWTGGTGKFIATAGVGNWLNLMTFIKCNIMAIWDSNRSSFCCI